MGLTLVNLLRLMYFELMQLCMAACVRLARFPYIPSPPLGGVVYLRFALAPPFALLLLGHCMDTQGCSRSHPDYHAGFFCVRPPRGAPLWRGLSVPCCAVCGDGALSMPGGIGLWSPPPWASIPGRPLWVMGMSGPHGTTLVSGYNSCHVAPPLFCIHGASSQCNIMRRALTQR